MPKIISAGSIDCFLSEKVSQESHGTLARVPRNSSVLTVHGLLVSEELESMGERVRGGESTCTATGEPSSRLGAHLPVWLLSRGQLS